MNSFFSRLFKSVATLKNKFSGTKKIESEKFHVRDIPEGSIIQIFDEHENQYEFTVHDHNRYGSFVRFTKFNDENLLGEMESKVIYPQTFPASKFSIAINTAKKEKSYSIQNIKHIKILEKVNILA